MNYLWEDKSGDKFSLLGNTGDLLFHIVNTKFTLLCIGGIVAVTVNNRLLGIFITLCFSLIGYVIIKEVFERFWHGFNRFYAISNDGIHFEWGLRNKLELFVPFSSIIHITRVGHKKSKLSTIYFDTNDTTILDRYPHLATDESFKLSFDMIQNGEKVLSILEDLRKDVNTINPPLEMEELGTFGLYKHLPLWINKVYCSIAFLLLSYGTYTFISLCDYNLIGYHETESVITKQDRKGVYKDADYHKFETKDGHQFYLETQKKLIGSTVTLTVSPLFSRTIDLEIENQRYYFLLTKYKGLSAISRCLTLIIVILISLYILYHRGFISTEDVGLFIIFPFILILISNSLFNLSYAFPP